MSATEPAAKKSRYLLTDWNPNEGYRRKRGALDGVSWV